MQKFKGSIRVEGDLNLPAVTIEKALIIDANGDIKDSVTTDAELAFLSGVTSSVQDQIDSKPDESITNDLVSLSGRPVNSTDLGTFTGTTIPDASTIKAALQALETADELKIPLTQKGANNGVATLDAGGKVPAAQLPSAVMTYEGTFDASDTPASPLLNGDGAADAGMVYLCNVAGSYDFGAGAITFAIGDWAVYSGSIWEKSTNSNSVVSVNSQTGVVVLDSDDISEGATNLYYTEGRFDTSFIAKDTDDLAEGVTNLYFTTARARTAAVADAINDGTTDIAPSQNAVFDALALKLDANVAITGATKTKITYDADGLVTAGADATTSDISEGSNLYFTDERAQDAIGTILVDTASVDLVYNDGTPSITATVLPAGVDHDSLMNYVANDHVDHSSVSIATAADSGLSGGGDITATRNLVVDINGTTAETSPDNADKILIYDNSATALKSMTRANFLAGVPLAPAGDINETSFSGANNQASPADITGLAFAVASVRAFDANIVAVVDASSNLVEYFKISGVRQIGGDWLIAVSSVGDNTAIVLTITTAGQVQYTSDNYAGFTSLTFKFRATTLSV